MAELIFSINLFHPFYDNGRLQNVSLVPDHRTQKLLDRYQLIAQQQQGAYSIYYVGEQKLSAFGASLADFFDQQPFTFSMQADPQHFTLISDLPLDSLNLLKYSSGETSQSETGLLVPTLAGSHTSQDGQVGEIKIYPADLFDRDGERVNSLFGIHIKVRTTVWEYYLFNSSQIKLVDPIISNGDGIEFDAPVRVTVADNDNVLLFSSGDKRFAMSESPQLRFDLYNTISLPEAESGSVPDTRKRLIKGLPTPTPNEISIQPGAGQDEIRSQMYIYL